MRKSQVSVIGAILIFVIATVGVIVFYKKIDTFMNQAKEETKEPIINAKAIEISQKLENVIKFKGESSLVYDIVGTTFSYYSNGNTTIPVIMTNSIANNFYIRGITLNNYYREICKISDGQLIGCALQGLTLQNLSQQCVVYNKNNLAMNNNLYYCPTERIYTIVEVGGQKYLVSVYPTPKINLLANNNLCNAYWVPVNGKEAVVFICDFWIKNDYCYFPRFIGSFVAYPQEGVNKKVTIKFENITEAPNLYPFCKKSFFYNIRLISS